MEGAWGFDGREGIIMHPFGGEAPRNPTKCVRLGFLAVDGRVVFQRVWKYQGSKYWINLA
jgi:hypothetical protein